MVWRLRSRSLLLVVELQAELVSGLVMPTIMAVELTGDGCPFGSICIELFSNTVHSAVDLAYLPTDVFDLVGQLIKSSFNVLEQFSELIIAHSKDYYAPSCIPRQYRHLTRTQLRGRRK